VERGHQHTRPSWEDIPGSGWIDWLEICAFGGRNVALVGSLRLRHLIAPFQLEPVDGTLRSKRQGVQNHEWVNGA